MDFVGDDGRFVVMPHNDGTAVCARSDCLIELVAGIDLDVDRAAGERAIGIDELADDVVGRHKVGIGDKKPPPVRLAMSGSY